MLSRSTCWVLAVNRWNFGKKCQTSRLSCIQKLLLQKGVWSYPIKSNGRSKNAFYINVTSFLRLYQWKSFIFCIVTSQRAIFSSFFERISYSADATFVRSESLLLPFFSAHNLDAGEWVRFDAFTCFQSKVRLNVKQEFGLFFNRFKCFWHVN